MEYKGINSISRMFRSIHGRLSLSVSLPGVSLSSVRRRGTK